MSLRLQKNLCKTRLQISEFLLALPLSKTITDEFHFSLIKELEIRFQQPEHIGGCLPAWRPKEQIQCIEKVSPL